MKKKIIIGILVVFTALLIGVGVYFFSSVKAVDENNTKLVDFTIKPGDSKPEIAKALKKANLIKNDKTAVVYMFFNNDLSLQAGTYSLSKSMDLKEILTKFNKGDIKVETLSITFVPGKRLLDYVDVITENFGYEKDEIIELINSKEFLNEMIEKYWFLTNDVLNDKIYYGLEGYIMPDTYEFMSKSSIKDIFIRLLDQTDKKLSGYKTDIESSKYNIHQILTIASIAELEANNESDRKGVSQVIYKRLNLSMALGMDVTTYYAEQKSLKEELTYAELNKVNAYNTRNLNMIGLPVGPISNPSSTSIDAALHPSDTDYLYFYADVKTGLVHFAKTNSEFMKIIREVG